MKRLPQRASLVAQTITILKEEIESGLWSKQLPGEHELCAQLHVSRVTIRSALNQLQREGWIRAQQGKPRTIVSGVRRAQPAASNRVLLLTATPLHLLQPFAIFWIDSLREHLAEAKFHLEIHASRAVYGSRSSHALQDLLDHLQPAGWVLYHSTEAMQRWFSDRALPCVVTGSKHQGVQLPSVDIDYRAVCRHAAGQFLARNHRRLVLVNPDPGAAGDLESEQGFREAKTVTRSLDAEVSVLRHDGTISGLCSRLDTLFRQANRPTALLVSRPGHVLTVMGHLMQSGLRLPQDVALISRDDDSFLERVVPSVARYTASSTGFARRISQVVLETVRGGVSPSADHRIMPRFVGGRTLG